MQKVAVFFGKLDTRVQVECWEVEAGKAWKGYMCHVRGDVVGQDRGLVRAAFREKLLWQCGEGWKGSGWRPRSLKGLLWRS